MSEINLNARNLDLEPSKAPERPPLHLKWQRLVPLFLIFTAGIVASVIVFTLLRHSENQQTRLTFERNASAEWTIIKNTIESDLTITGTLRAYFNASDFVSRDEFSAFTGPFFSKQKSIKALEWIPRI